MLFPLIAACILRSQDDFRDDIKTISKNVSQYDRRECSSISGPPYFRLSEHILVSDSQGDIKEERHDRSLSKAFREIMSGYANSIRDKKHPPRLLFYFNGGLNSQFDMEQQAEKQIPCMMADGYYPVFFVWDTGFFNSYKEQVTRISDGFLGLDDKFLNPRTPFLVAGQILSGIGQEPMDLAIQSSRSWDSLLSRPECSLKIKNPSPSNNSSDEAQDNCWESPSDNNNKVKLITEDTIDVQDFGAETGKFLFHTALSPVQVVSTPIAHGIGESAWQNYLRRTRTTLRQSWEFVPWWKSKERNRINTLRESFPRGTGVFAEFFTALEEYRTKDGNRLSRIEIEGDNGEHIDDILCPIDSKVGNEACQKSLRSHLEALIDERIYESLKEAKITLIGHSMGGIVVNGLIESFPQLPYSDIVVMASAASFRDTQRAINYYYEVHKNEDTQLNNEESKTRFFSLMLHPKNDTGEQQGGGTIPSGSLLMWIDQMYEVAKTPEDRTFGFWPNVKTTRHMFSEKAQKNMVFRVFNQRKSDSNPVEHGDFNEDRMCFWRPAFWGVDKIPEWIPYYQDKLTHALDVCRKDISK